MKKRIMVIGPNDKDKRKIVELIEGTTNLPCISSMVYLDQTIQVPSSYLRGSGMTKHIIATQQNASAVLMILSDDRVFPVYSPNFAKAFRIPSIGIILKKTSDAQQDRTDNCWSELVAAKVDYIHVVDVEDPENCQQFLLELVSSKKE